MVKYVDETSKEQGIGRHMLYNHDVLAMDWSSERQVWSLNVEVNGSKQILEALFIISGTGLFDYYKAPRAALIPKLARRTRLLR